MITLFIMILFFACSTNSNPIITLPLRSEISDTLIDLGHFKWFDKLSIDTVINIGGKEIKGTVGIISFQEKEQIAGSNEVRNELLAFKTMKDGKVFMSFDCNGNNSLIDEKLYICDGSVKVSIDSLKLLDGGKITHQHFYIVPTKSSFGPISKGKDKLIQYGVSIVPIYKYADLVDSNKVYQIVITNMLRNFYTKENSFVWIISNNIIKSGFKIWETPMYKIGDTLYLKNGMYKFTDLDSLGQSCKFVKLPFSGSHRGIETGDLAIEIELNNILDNKKINLSTDKYTLLDFWGTWCNPCRELTPDLQEIYSKYGFTKLKLISIASDDRSSVMNYIKGQNIKWDNVVDPFDVGPICRKYKVNNFPTFVLIDPKGRIVYRGIGKVGLEKIKLIISGI